MTGASLLWPGMTGPVVFYGGVALIGLGLIFWLIGRRREASAEGIPPRTPTVWAGVTVDGSSNTTTIAGGDLYITNPQQPIREFANAPHLIWSGVRAEKLGKSYEVIVACHNVGATALVRPDNTWVRSTVDVLGPPIPGTSPILAEVTHEQEQMEFDNFDLQGPIRPGAFDLHMQCKEGDPIPGEREVQWRVTYMDDDLERGYITECSARVVFVGVGTPRIDGLPALDNTSRKTRNDDYNNFMNGKRQSSTGPRRPHQ